MDSSEKELVIQGLVRAGLLEEHEVYSEARVQEAVRKFQVIRGLDSDGVAGNITIRELNQLRFCAVPDRMTADGARCRWDHTNWDGSKWIGTPKNLELSYHVRNPESSKLPLEVTLQAFADAFRRWEVHAALKFIYVTEPEKANILLDFGKIDGPSSTLAYQYLPCGPQNAGSQLTGKYDDKEDWVYYPDGPSPPSRVDLAVVACHEIGHGLGLEHGPGKALLAPTYDRNVRVPQEWDIKEIQIRYGPKLTTPNAPSTPATGRILVELNGEKIFTNEVKITAK